MSDKKESMAQDKEVEVKEEVLVEKTKVEEDKKKVKNGEMTFLKRLEALVIDQIFIGAVAYILLLIFDIALRYVAGYYVSEMIGMYIIFYTACSIIYPLISESTKFANTIGKKFAGLKTVVE